MKNITIIETLLDADAVAAVFQVSKQTLRRWRQAGFFPSPMRIGRRAIRWRVSDLKHFIEQNLEQGKNNELCREVRQAGPVG